MDSNLQQDFGDYDLLLQDSTKVLCCIFIILLQSLYGASSSLATKNMSVMSVLVSRARPLRVWPARLCLCGKKRVKKVQGFEKVQKEGIISQTNASITFTVNRVGGKKTLLSPIEASSPFTRDYYC